MINKRKEIKVFIGRLESLRPAVIETNCKSC